MASESDESVQFDGPPTQHFTTAGLLMDLADRKVSLTLRDGSVISGVLRSYDEFGSFVIQDAVEHIFLNHKYAERNLGVWIVRGESVALLGKINIEQEQAFHDELQWQWEHVDFASLEKERDAQRSSFEEKKADEVQAGLRKGLVASTNTGNPYRF